MNHPLTDEVIAEHWPEDDTPEGRIKIRRQFDALMAQVRKDSVPVGFPRYVETMSRVVVQKSASLPDRIATLRLTLGNLPESLQQYQWVADVRQQFGSRYVRAVVGDNGHGLGRQWLADTPQHLAGLAEFIAAANPDTVSMLLDRIVELETQVVLMGGEP